MQIKPPVHQALMTAGAVSALAAFAVTAQPRQASAQAGALDTAAIERAIGKAGQLTADVYKVTFPRSDLHVTRDAVAIKPGLALTGWAAFKAVGSEAVTHGDLALKEGERVLDWARTIVADARAAGAPAPAVVLPPKVYGPEDRGVRAQVLVELAQVRLDAHRQLGHADVLADAQHGLLGEFADLDVPDDLLFHRMPPSASIAAHFRQRDRRWSRLLSVTFPTAASGIGTLDTSAGLSNVRSLRSIPDVVSTGAAGATSGRRRAAMRTEGFRMRFQPTASAAPRTTARAPLLLLCATAARQITGSF